MELYKIIVTRHYWIYTSIIAQKEEEGTEGYGSSILMAPKLLL
jgi:hypothetical protein